VPWWCPVIAVENALLAVWGCLGPTRMVDENAVEVVKATADYLSHTLSPGAEAG
jgi:transcriptional regulator of heat shock response